MKQKKSKYEEYLEKYCRTRKVSREEAEQHYIVREYKRMCEEPENAEERVRS